MIMQLVLLRMLLEICFYKMFNFEDFEEDGLFYQNRFFDEKVDMGNFPSSLMMITNALKNIDYDSTLKGGHHLMMKIFNMTGLEFNDSNEEALNIIMGLVSHVFALLMTCDNKESYFNYFDNVIIRPMIGDNID